MFRYLHHRYGKSVLIDYWRGLGREYYAPRTSKWTSPQAIASDWREYFAKEPNADVSVSCDDARGVIDLDIRVCPAIKHLRDSRRDIVPYFCEHCDHVCGAMAETAGYSFIRTGGMGSCQQRFTRVTARGKETR
jgi:hypothetical protein